MERKGSRETKSSVQQIRLFFLLRLTFREKIKGEGRFKKQRDKRQSDLRRKECVIYSPSFQEEVASPPKLSLGDQTQKFDLATIVGTVSGVTKESREVSGGFIFNIFDEVGGMFGQYRVETGFSIRM
mmetsp:Transcript_4410/g.4937  ORF Transcript_4410/g.4937 Transcript_4410/m.4937 type:complete len:127 (+) Transcript_4410:134-514(+)